MSLYLTVLTETCYISILGWDTTLVLGECSEYMPQDAFFWHNVKIIKRLGFIQLFSFIFYKGDFLRWHLPLCTISPWPMPAMRCLPLPHLIQNTFVLACIINLHQFAPRQQGIQSTCTLCKPRHLLSPRLWQKKLVPCIFIMITCEETWNLIEYVRAGKTTVRLGLVASLKSACVDLFAERWQTSVFRNHSETPQWQRRFPSVLEIEILLYEVSSNDKQAVEST